MRPDGLTSARAPGHPGAISAQPSLGPERHPAPGDRLEAIDRHIAEHLADRVAELTRLCAIPSVSARRQGIEECAHAVARALRSRGLAVEIVPTAGHPVVLGHVEGASERTMLLYNHYDVQPPEPLELWESPPFEARVRAGRLYARGAKDDKGELVARLAALDALRAVDGRLPSRVTWLVEGEEEIGSPSLAAFVAGHQDRLRCDAAIWEESGIDGEGRPLIKLGARGLLYVELSYGRSPATATRAAPISCPTRPGGWFGPWLR